MKYFISCVFTVLILTCVMLMQGCIKESADAPAKVADTVDCIQPGELVTYTKDIKKIMDTYCTGKDLGSCHQSVADDGYGEFYDFTTYDAIYAEAKSGILIEKLFNPTYAPMPPNNSNNTTPLSDCEKLKFQTWVDQGALE